MKTYEDKIKFQKNKLVKFDETTKETATLIGRIDISTKQAYEKERHDKRITLCEKIDKTISNIKG